MHLRIKKKFKKKRRESSKIFNTGKTDPSYSKRSPQRRKSQQRQTSIKNYNSLAHDLKKDKIRFSSEFLTEMSYNKTNEQHLIYLRK